MSRDLVALPTDVGVAESHARPWWELHVERHGGVQLGRICHLFDSDVAGPLADSTHEAERKVLAYVMNLWIDASDYNTRCPLRLRFEGGDTRAILCEELAERFDLIDSVRRRAVSPEIKARFSEFVWSFKRKQAVVPEVCREAVKAYLVCCEAIPVSRETACFLLERLLRALRLAAGLKDEELQAIVVARWEAALQQELSEGGRSLALQASRVLARTKNPLRSSLAAIMRQQVAKIESVDHLPNGIEEEMCDLAEKLCDQAEPAAAYRAKGVALALQRAHKALAVDKQGLLSVIAARDAVDRAQRNQPEALPEALEALQAASTRISEDIFETYSLGDLDVTPLVRSYQSKLSNVGAARDALATLTSFQLLPVKQELLAEVNEEVAAPPSVSSIVTSIVWSPDGRSLPEYSLHSVDAAEREKAFSQRLQQKARQRRDFSAFVAVKSSLAYMRKAHDEAALLRAVEDLVQRSQFVAADRREFLARGLLAGLEGDMIQAMHYLIPQLEAALRHQLTRSAAATIAPGRRLGEIQVAMFDEVFSRIEKQALLSEDILFALRGLLTEEAGGNLRNKHCHGLMEHADYESAAAYFLFWLVLKLVIDTR